MKTSLNLWRGIAIVTGLFWLQTLPLPAQPSDSTDLVAPTTNLIATPNAVATTNNVANTEPSRPLRRRGPVVSIGGSATVAAGETAEVVVAVGGSATAIGKVQDAVVAIGGDAEANSDVREAVVAIGGDAIARGKVGESVVAIAGNAEVWGEVRHTVVAIMGDVKLGSNAIVNGDVVAVGGKVDAAEGAQIKGKIVEVSMAQYPILAPLKGLADWLRDCILKFRLLAPQPGWYWIVVGVFFLLYLLIAAAAPRPVAACVNELQQRPATTFLLGLLMKLLLPLIYFVLAVTGIGVFVIPFIWVAVFIGVIIGKVALFEFLGGGMLRLFGVNLARPVLALLTGFILITVFYMVPFLSLLIYTLVGLWALGAVTTAMFSGARKEVPPRPSDPPIGFAPTNSPAPGPAETPIPPVTNFSASADVPSSPSPANEPASPPPLQQQTTVNRTPEAYALPRAGFWERMGAAFLDVILVAILVGFIAQSPIGQKFGPPTGLVAALAYFAGMWAWKGTSVGGIVLHLKVVRLDDQPVTFAVALVRGLAAALSVVVFFMGFFWMILDRDKQTWHDKIAGTVVVRSPRAVPLVCL